MILGSHKRASRFVGMLVLAMGLLVSLAACGSTPSRSGASATTSTTTPKASTTKPTTDAPTNISFGTGSVGPADPTTTVPNERGRTIAPDFEAGQNVIITSTGFEPSTLEANVAAPVVWTNLSGRPQRIIFINFAVDSGTVPPGGTFMWSTTNAVDISYLSDTTGWHGTLQMNPNSP